VRLDHYFNDATFDDWEQASPDLPDWQTSRRHLTADGKLAVLTHPQCESDSCFSPPTEPPASVS